MGTTLAPERPVAPRGGAAPPTAEPGASEATPTVDRRAALAGLAVVCVLAAVLRFWAFGRVDGTPFYDAAVRSMGSSWHDFFYGAIEPGGRVAIDKTPVDLWLQVASTKVLGFSSVSLRLPQAVCGVLAVPLLFDVVRRGFGDRVGLAAALALAVLPVAVLTSRSDTMDTVMGTLLLLAVWVVVRARPERRARAVVLAGAIAGLAFEVKLFQAVVGLPAIALLGLLAVPGTLRRRLGVTALAGLAFLVVAAAWPVVATVLPGGHPVPLGSKDGSIASVLLGYNGLDRLGAPTSGNGSANLTSLLRDGSGSPLAPLVGIELAAALVVGTLAALVTGIRGGRALPAVVRGLARGDVAGALPEDPAALRRVLVGTALAVWFLTGLLVFSAMGQLRPRYLEAFTPALAGVLGVGLVVLADRALGARRRVAAVVVAVVLAAVLAAPVAESARLVRTGAGDSGTAGRLPAPVVARLSAYLRAHQGAGVRFQVASSGITTVAPLIVRDGRPVLVLGGIGARPLVTLPALRSAIAAGQVRFVLAGAGPARLGTIRWVQRHGTDVSAAAGLPRRVRLYRVDGPGVAGRSGTTAAPGAARAVVPGRR
ncbi:ArnT family glycosyltransferase [Patulibacter minatonensis]|uniref:ArnT family glycosyltransferase n=1 Tax=Patulibacter minatonensis TaxID=298163 RepID=UPI00047D9EC9|nr:glycosyltransferase family 39 protein [Patulibacter minatonensis]